MLSNMRQAQAVRQTDETIKVNHEQAETVKIQKRANTGIDYSKPLSADKNGKRRVEALLNKAGLGVNNGNVEVLELHMTTPPVEDADIAPDDDPYAQKNSRN